DPRIDELRQKMLIEEDERYSAEYHEPDKRSISNALQIIFKDGSSTDKIEVEYPIGHKFRREEGIPILLEKFKRNLLTQFDEEKSNQIFELCQDKDKLLDTPVDEFMKLLAK
ncbi:MAG: 2-methylcitrate dehydratase, partial [Gammaproteobacteria bacterium]